jgi:hypothetical protein
MALQENAIGGRYGIFVLGLVHVEIADDSADDTDSC